MAINNFYIYSNCDFAQKNAASTRMLYYAKAISNQNNAVYLVSCCSDDINHSSFLEVMPNVFVLEKKQLTRKIIPTIRFLKKLHAFSKKKDGTQTFLLYPYPFIFLELFTVLYFLFVKKKRVYYELNEVRKYASDFHEPVSLKKIKYSSKKIIYKSIYGMLDKLLPYYEGLICISSNIETYGKQFNKNTIRIPILTDPDISISNSGKKYAEQDSFNIGFSGSILPEKENLVSFVKVIDELNGNHYDVTFNLCGTIKTEDYQLLIKDLVKPERIKYHGNLGEHELSAFLSQQNLLVIPRGFSLQNKFGFSTKLSDYMNHKKIILVTDVSDNKLYIKDGLNGFVVPPNDDEMMLEKIKYIIENYGEINSSITLNAQKTSKEKFDYRLFEKPLRLFMLSK